MRDTPLPAKLRASVVATAILLTGCAVAPERIEQTVGATLSESRAPSRNATGLGVALAGGGTKAASFAMGVLAALADSPRGIAQADAISSVSGGGYAAFFLYSKLLVRDRNAAERRLQASDYFADCLPRVYQHFLEAPGSSSPPLCADQGKSKGRSPEDDRYRFQQFVRCRQDVLENDCHQELDGSNWSEIPNAAGMFAATAMMVVPNFFARTVFDWPLNLSPSRRAYIEGIGSAYGLYPLSIQAASDSAAISCNDSSGRPLFLNCSEENPNNVARLTKKNIEFDDLFRLTSANPGVPVWYINATASKGRSIFSWARAGRRDFTKYTMQMSPSSARSGFHGHVRELGAHLNLLDAVTAAAAFFDSNEVAARQPYRLAGALALHNFVLDWGVDIPNPNVDRKWRWLHNALPLWPWPWTTLSGLPSFLPVPWFFLDGGARIAGGAKPNQYSSYIRLLDGGNNDNLGAYTLLEAGMKDIIISDHAQDTHGEMDDLCILHNEVWLRTESRLIVPGLDGFAAHCAGRIAESECEDGACLERLEKLKAHAGERPRAPGGYPVRRWVHAVLAGCIRPKSDAPGLVCDGDVTRIYVLKPAMDTDAFEEKHIAWGKVRQSACNSVREGTCEVAAYIARSQANRSGSEAADFPQHSTVGMTFASNGARYGAYRELARGQMNEALDLRDQAQSKPDSFGAVVRCQADFAMPRVERSDGAIKAPPVRRPAQGSCRAM